MPTTGSPRAPHHPSAALGAAPVHQLGDGVIDLRRPRYEQVVGRRGDEVGDRARDLERLVFERSFGMSTAEHAAHYDPFDEASFFLAVLDRHDGDVVGAIRVVEPSPAGLVSAIDIGLVWGLDRDQIEHPTPGTVLPLGSTWDIATLAVLPDRRRGGIISRALYQAMCMSSREAGVRTWLSILDLTVHRMFAWQYQRVFRAYDVEPRAFAGSVSLPVWCDLDEYQRRLRRRAPALHTMLFGQGACDDVAPLDWPAASSALRPRLALAQG